MTVLGHKLAAAFYGSPTAAAREVRRVWRILIGPAVCRAAYDARYTASLSGLFPQMMRTQRAICNAPRRYVEVTMLTVDSIIGSHRQRDLQAGFSFLRLVPGMLKFAIKPMRCISALPTKLQTSPVGRPR
jgi:hypothetical protein